MNFRNTAAVLVLVVCSLPLRAQFTTASLSGFVRDSSGAVIAEARVTVENTETRTSRVQFSGPDGAFLFPVLRVGTYRLMVEKAGFSTYSQEGITLAVGQTASQNVILQVGAIAQEVSVTGNAAMVNTQTATLNQLVSRQQVVDLPLNGRAAQSLVFLASGAVDSTSRYCVFICQGGVYPDSQVAAVSGGGTANVNYLMDGAGHNDSYINVNLPFPNPDAVQEFSLQSNNMSAEYGQSSSVVNVVTKSGTNTLHGNLFEFVRNGSLNARNFFAPAQDTLKRNQFGGALGGPILKDKLFFFGTYQGTRIRTAAQGRINFVPTPAERGGDFSSTARQLVDPAANNAPFSRNQIPLSRFTGPSKYFLQRIPLPNGPGGQLTYAGPAARQNDNQVMPKLDWVRGAHQLSGRYFYSKYSQPPDMSQLKQNLLTADENGNEVRVQTLALNHTFVGSPTLLFNTWFGWDQQVGGSLSGDPPGAGGVTFPAAGVKIESGAVGVPPAMEALNVAGFFRIATGHLGQFNRGDWRLREVVTMERGPHQLILGGEVVRLNQDINNSYLQSGVFRFTSRLSGSNLADFLLGTATDFQQGAGQFQNIRGTLTGFFVQDNWRVSQKLVLNLGVRWDPFWPYTDTQDRAVCFAPGRQSQRYPNAPAGLTYGGDPGCPHAGFEPSVAHVAPRVGLAWQLGGKTVLRGGAGIYYTSPQTSQNNGNAGAQPFGAGFTLSGVSFEDPWGSAGLRNPFPERFGGGALPSRDVTFALPVQIGGVFPLNFSPSTMGTWNLRLERQIGVNWLLSGAYVGNAGYHLSSNQYGRRQLNPAIYIPGGSTVGNTQARRPYQKFGSIGLHASDYHSNYNSLQWNVEKRFSRGLQLLVNYTWSKMIDDFAPAQEGTNSNPFNRRLDRGPSSDDVPHILHFSGLWQFPSPKVQGKAAAWALRGWQLSSITTWQSGFPFAVRSGVDNSFTGINNDRADYTGTGSPKLSGLSHAQQVERFFNTSVFVPNAVGTFGNTGKNILRGPRVFNTDLGLIKTTDINERAKAQFRAEFFNLFNNVNFGLPGNVLGQPAFGKITSAKDPRILQLALKLLF